jgi:hypothetical protein
VCVCVCVCVCVMCRFTEAGKIGEDWGLCVYALGCGNQWNRQGQVERRNVARSQESLYESL